MSKGDHTREYIVEKAAELFNIYGYHGCSMSDIMKATGLKKGGIYNHFSGKDEIALAAFDFAFQKVFHRFRDRLDEVNRPTEKLFAILEAYESLHKDPILEGGCPIGNTAVDATGTFPLLKERAATAINSLRYYIDIKVKEGIDAGEFKKGIDGLEVASLIMSTMEGAILMSRMNKDDVTLNHAVEFLTTYFREKLLVDSSNSPQKDAS